VASSLAAGALLRAYIERTLRQPGLRDGGPQLLEKMITEQGTKQPRSEKDLAEIAKLRPAEVRGMLGLSDAGVARSLDTARGVWELTHDFIAHAVARFLGRQHGELRRYALAYAAPALLAANLSVGAGMAVWEQTSTARISAALCDLGVRTAQQEDGISANASPSDDRRLSIAGPMLARIPNVTNLIVYGAIQDLEPLKGPAALRSLDIQDAKVTNLEAIYDLPKLVDLKASPDLLRQFVQYRKQKGLPYPGLPFPK
jgi:hypothetical protein